MRGPLLVPLSLSRRSGGGCEMYHSNLGMTCEPGTTLTHTEKNKVKQIISVLPQGIRRRPRHAELYDMSHRRGVMTQRHCVFLADDFGCQTARWIDPLPPYCVYSRERAFAAFMILVQRTCGVLSCSTCCDMYGGGERGGEWGQSSNMQNAGANPPTSHVRGGKDRTLEPG